VPILACPTDVFRATPARVWDALTLPREMEKWMGAMVLEGPDRALEAGDRLVLGVALGSRIKAYFDIKEAERPNKFTLDIDLPLGIVNHEVIQISAVGPTQCRVTFN
jgi:uncharacterized protein YndB with AHSA1/START domain